MIKRIVSSFIALIIALMPFGGEPERKCRPQFNGTFIQSWYCLWWNDARWQEEIGYMKEAGIEYLIVQDVASFTDADNAEIHYPTELPCFENCEKYGDVIGDALRNCSGSGIKVFIGLADFTDWWVTAGLTKQYDAICDKMALMTEEIYNKYYGQYSDTFYGWYFTPEINNVPTMKLSILNIAGGLNKIIDTADALNPDMPVLLSPYFTNYISVPSVVAALPEWQIFMQAVHFRDGDIFCPQDAVGAGWIKMNDLEKVWKMYSAAVSSCDKNIKLWANCENMTVARERQIFMPPATIEKENATATLDRFVEQMDAASKYAENIITFSFNHYYCPAQVNPVYYSTYLDYLKNGKLETEAPTQPGNAAIENGVLSWSESADNMGIAYYIVYDNGKAAARIEASEDLSFAAANANHSYSVAAVDGAGNISAAAEAKQP